MTLLTSGLEEWHLATIQGEILITIKSKNLLVKKAREALQNSHAFFSNFRVGAAVLTSDDKIFTGCNIENPSLTLNICAERLAIFKALSEGAEEIKAIVITSSSDDLCPPCGACRQLISEYAPDADIILISASNKGKCYKISELLPHPYHYKRP